MAKKSSSTVRADKSPRTTRSTTVAPENEKARSRVLEAAWRLINDREDVNVSLLEIAREAGVSRQTVYVNFGNRAGLLLAMVEHRDATSPEIAAMSQTASFDELLQHWFAYVPKVFKVARALAAAGLKDPLAKAAFSSRMNKLQAGLLARTRQLEKLDLLAPGWTSEAAAQWLYHLLHLDTWQHLVIDRGWTKEQIVQRTLETIRSTILRARL